MRRQGEGSGAELRKLSSLTRHPQARCGLGVPVWGGGLGPLFSRVISTLRRSFRAPDLSVVPAAHSRPAPRAAPPEPARLECSLLLAGPIFLSAMLRKPIPVTDSGPLKRGGEGCRGGAPGAAEPGASGSPRQPAPTAGGRAAATPPRRRPGCVTRRRPRSTPGGSLG